MYHHESPSSSLLLLLLLLSLSEKHGALRHIIMQYVLYGALFHWALDMSFALLDYYCVIISPRSHAPKRWNQPRCKPCYYFPVITEEADSTPIISRGVSNRCVPMRRLRHLGGGDKKRQHLRQDMDKTRLLSPSSSETYASKPWCSRRHDNNSSTVSECAAKKSRRHPPCRGVRMVLARCEIGVSRPLRLNPLPPVRLPDLG